MSVEATVQALLEADTGAGGAATLLTGGIYILEDTGLDGINMTSAPSAYDTTGALKPTCLLKLRSEIPFGVRDGRWKTTRMVLEVWLYSEWKNGFTTLHQARERIRTLLDEARFSDTIICRWAGNIVDKGQAPELANASMCKAEYVVIGWRE